MTEHPNRPNGHRANGAKPSRAKPHRDRKVLPHNLDAEASILGGVILHNEVLGDVPTLETNDFYDHKHKVVWEAIRNLEAAGKPFDVVVLEHEIERVGKLDALGGIAFLGELALRVPTHENVVHYAKIVRDLSLLRRIILKADDIQSRGFDWSEEPDELLGELQAELQLIDTNYREANQRIPYITIEDSLDELEKLARTPIIQTPFAELNKSLGFGGLLSGQLYYLAGGTGFGKTSFVAAIVRFLAEQGHPALIAFWEMFAGYYTARMSAGVLQVHANRILRGEVQRSAIRDSLPRDMIRLLDAPSIPMLKRAVEDTIRKKHLPPLVVIDYIQLLAERVLATMPRPDLRLATSQASAELRDLAKKTGATIICVTAAGRSASKKLVADVRKLPARDLIDSSKESGSIEFDSAGLIVLSVSDEKEGDENIATISVAKARFGDTVHIDARYAGATGAWRSLDRVTKITKAVTPADDGSLRAIIVRALDLLGPLSKNKIQEATGKNKGSVLSEVDAMLEVGAAVYVKNKIGLPKHLDALAAANQASLPAVLQAQIAAAERASDTGSEVVPETGSGGES